MTNISHWFGDGQIRSFCRDFSSVTLMQAGRHFTNSSRLNPNVVNILDDLTKHYNQIKSQFDMSWQLKLPSYEHLWPGKINTKGTSKHLKKAHKSSLKCVPACWKPSLQIDGNSADNNWRNSTGKKQWLITLVKIHQILTASRSQPQKDKMGKCGHNTIWQSAFLQMLYDKWKLIGSFNTLKPEQKRWHFEDISYPMKQILCTTNKSRNHLRSTAILKAIYLRVHYRNHIKWLDST